METRVTVDTNVFDQDKLARIREAVEGLGVELAFTTVTERERPGSELEFVVASPVRETMVWGESRWGEAVLGEPGLRDPDNRGVEDRVRRLGGRRVSCSLRGDPRDHRERQFPEVWCARCAKCWRAQSASRRDDS